MYDGHSKSYFFLAQQPLVGQDQLIYEVSRSQRLLLIKLKAKKFHKPPSVVRGKSFEFKVQIIHTVFSCHLKLLLLKQVAFIYLCGLECETAEWSTALQVSALSQFRCHIAPGTTSMSVERST